MVMAQGELESQGEKELRAMSETWKTKYGQRRVRHDPPTLQEAIAAAKGLTDSLQAQAEIAASLMGLPVENVRPEVMKVAHDRGLPTRTISADRGRRAVVVEHRVSRRPARIG
jgi:microcystin degradation protein MlrC